MDIGNIISGAFGGLNIWQVVSGLFAGALIVKLLDEIILQIMAKYFPDAYLEKLYAWVKEYDDKYIDKFKEKYPKSGKELETKLSGILDKMKDIILDK